MNKTLERSISGLLFLAVLIGGMLFSQFSLCGVLAVVLVASSIEFYTLMPDGGCHFEKFCVCLTELMAFIGCFLLCSHNGSAGMILLKSSPLPVFAAFFSMLFSCGKKHGFRTDIFFPLLYVLIPICSMLPLCYGTSGEYEPMLLLSIFILAWSNDVFAYVYGMAFGQKEGRRKLAPEISPKKSWAGVIGGTLNTFLAAAVIWFLFGSRFFHLHHWLVVALIVSVAGVAGDLFESMIKRYARVKDAGNVIPGHGGILDRFDDIFFVMPLSTIYLSLVSIL